MIKLVQRKNIDINLYSACLNRADNYRIYAEYWYLDILTNNKWDCLVFNNYEAVMPLPFQSILGFKIISQPIYCQQLGVFHAENFQNENFQLFTNKLSHKLVRGYHFNEENQSKINLKHANKINQILKFPTDFDVYFSKLRKNRKQEIKNGLPSGYQINSAANDISFITLLKNNYPEIREKLTLTVLEKLVQEVQSRNLGITITVYKNDKAVASSFYLISKNRLIQLCNAKSANLTFNTNTFIVEYVLRNFANQFEVLDFEGSNIKGVNEFNTSFRAETKNYATYQSKLF